MIESYIHEDKIPKSIGRIKFIIINIIETILLKYYAAILPNIWQESNLHIKLIHSVTDAMTKVKIIIIKNNYEINNNKTAVGFFDSSRY